MRKLIGAGLLALVTASSAQAEMVTFQFKATIESMFEGFYAYTTPVASSTRNGSLVAVGDTITGTFSFDTATPFVDTVSDATPDIGGSWSYFEVGSNNQTALSATFDKTGHTYQGNIVRTDWILVNDKAPGAGQDLFRIDEWENTGNYQRGILILQDADGTALSSFAIPQAFDLAAFEQASYEYRFQGETGNSMSANARIFELTQLPAVPEPATLGMLAIGLLAVGARYRAAAARRH